MCSYVFSHESPTLIVLFNHIFGILGGNILIIVLVFFKKGCAMFSTQPLRAFSKEKAPTVLRSSAGACAHWHVETRVTVGLLGICDLLQWLSAQSLRVAKAGDSHICRHLLRV